jgi:histidyl-tRNA synthetase
LREWLQPVATQLSADSQARLAKNPLRLLDSKAPGDISLLRGVGWPASTAAPPPLPHMLDSLDAESRTHWEQVLAGLTALKIPYEIDHGLVRGLDYYTRTAFEVHDGSLGAQSALGGGGRYDGLIEALGGPATPGVGFSIGMDRVLLALEERGAAAEAKPGLVYVAAMDATRSEAMVLARDLRQAHRVEIDVEARGMGAQMKAADKSGAKLVVLLGEDEWKRGEVVVKDLATGQQSTIARSRLAEHLKDRA